jgi:hypothetical protein
MSTVKNMLSELRNTWSSVASKIPSEQQNREMVGLNIAG